MINQKIIKAFRIEDMYGTGIYHHSKYFNTSALRQVGRLNNLHSRGNDRPNLNDDFNSYQIQRFDNGSFRFGCVSLNALKEWFDNGNG